MGADRVRAVDEGVDGGLREELLHRRQPRVGGGPAAVACERERPLIGIVSGADDAPVVNSTAPSSEVMTGKAFALL